MTFIVSSIETGAVGGGVDVTTSNFNLDAYELLLVYMASNPAPPSSVASVNVISGESFSLQDYYATDGFSVRIYIFRGMVYAAGEYTITFHKSDGVFSHPYVYSILKVSAVNSSGIYGSGAFSTVTRNSITSATSISNTISLSAAPLHIAAFAHTANETISIGSGFTNLANVSRTSPSVSLRVGYAVDVSAVSATWATSSDAVVMSAALKTEQTRPPKKIIVL